MPSNSKLVIDPAWDGIGNKVYNVIQQHWEICGQDIEVVLEEAADVMQSLVRVRTGDLQNSIRVVNVQVSADRASGEIEATMPYAGFQEFGTFKMAAHPYFSPGWDYFLNQYPGAVIRDLSKVVIR